VAPTLWWMKKHAVNNPIKNPNIFYENTCTPEEIERFRHQDMIEQTAYLMKSTPGYGYHMMSDPKHL